MKVYMLAARTVGSANFAVTEFSEVLYSLGPHPYEHSELRSAPSGYK
jgi:hypothetical protein